MIFRSILQAASVLPLLWASTSAQTACNNSPSLCNKAYNNITYLGAHDSPFLRNKDTSFSTSGNQYFDSVTQLSAGVRLLSAQVHKFNSSGGGTQWRLCHTSCDLLDAGTLESWLKNITGWMDSNPNEVVTLLIVNSDNAPASTLGEQFKSSGISKYAYTPPSTSQATTQWPTLQSMISNNTRLVTFVASLGTADSNYPFLLDEFTHVYENDFENKSPANYSCLPDRPTSLQNNPTSAKSSGRMFLMNHFLYSTALFGIETPNNTYVATTNGQTGLGSLGEQLDKCTSTYSKAPTFVLVDFFSVGPAIDAVDKTNGVSGATGRKTVSSAVIDESTSGVAEGKKRSLFAVVVAVVMAVVFSL